MDSLNQNTPFIDELFGISVTDGVLLRFRQSSTLHVQEDTFTMGLVGSR
jgi:hypothetical protein